jgi:CubicO group peptidase (beta-lactamase class C family)
MQAAEKVGLSTQVLDSARTYVAGCVERGEIAGAVTLVARDGQVAQLACVGLRDIEAGRLMEPDTIFRLASMTKPIVSVGALMLVEAGKLRLDHALSRYVPEFADAAVFAGVDGDRVTLAPLERPITVHDLLTHTSGITDDPPDPALEATYDDLGDLRYKLPELMRRLAIHPLGHQPGRHWNYGWSHHVLGRVIEVAADQPLDDYLDASIFRPLGMPDSGFYVPPEQVERLAVVYEQVPGGVQRLEDTVTRRVTEHFPLLGGGGGLVSTVLDYGRFVQMLQRRGELDGVRLLRTDTVELMTRNRLDSPLCPIRIANHVFKGQGYGLGVGVKIEPSARALAGSVGTYWWAGSWNNRFWIDPVTKLSAIFMVQSQPFAFVSVGEQFWSQVCRALLPE